MKELFVPSLLATFVAMLAAYFKVDVETLFIVHRVSLVALVLVFGVLLRHWYLVDKAKRS